MIPMSTGYRANQYDERQFVEDGLNVSSLGDAGPLWMNVLRKNVNRNWLNLKRNWKKPKNLTILPGLNILKVKRRQSRRT